MRVAPWPGAPGGGVDWVRPGARSRKRRQRRPLLRSAWRAATASGGGGSQRYHGPLQWMRRRLGAPRLIPMAQSRGHLCLEAGLAVCHGVLLAAADTRNFQSMSGSGACAAL